MLRFLGQREFIDFLMCIVKIFSPERLISIVIKFPQPFLYEIFRE